MAAAEIMRTRLLSLVRHASSPHNLPSRLTVLNGIERSCTAAAVGIAAVGADRSKFRAPASRKVCQLSIPGTDASIPRFATSNSSRRFHRVRKRRSRRTWVRIAPNPVRRNVEGVRSAWPRVQRRRSARCSNERRRSRHADERARLGARGARARDLNVCRLRLRSNA